MRRPATPAEGPTRSARSERLEAWVRPARALFASLRRENAHRLLAVTVCMTLTAAAAEYLLDLRWQSTADGRPMTLGDAIWWAVVTLTTVGYGDVTPRTFGGRVVGVVLMLSGVVLLSLVTASIASVLVERRIREERGLESLTWKGHTLLCGWNENAEEVLGGLTRAQEGRGRVVLVNELEEDQLNSIRFRFRDLGELRFVRGDFTSEAVLKMANVQDAGACIILADTSAAGSTKSDERVILAVLSIKALAPHLRVCVEALDRSNVTHLRRAHADEVIVRGKHTGFFLVNAVTEPGVSRAVEELLSFELGNLVRRREIPERFVGKTFRELANHLRDHDNAIVIGIISEAPGVDIQGILAGDMSAIDEFIKRKFEEAGQDVSQAARREDVVLNPQNDRIIDQYDVAVVIPSLSHHQ